MKAQSATCEAGTVGDDPVRERVKTTSVELRVLMAEAIRRTCDIVVSSVALICAAPIMLILAVLIRLTSPGPAIFRQQRVGRNRRNRSTETQYDGPERRKHDVGGQLFWFLKFRTMYVDARERFPELYEYKYSPDEVRQLRFKVRKDPRHTRLGRRLRIMTLDELPNFWNTLKGDMTLVGPRPDIPEMTQYYRPNQRRIFDVKPGITGYAQVSGRCNLRFRTTKALDLQYVKERSLRVDLNIVLATIASVLRAHGSY